MCTYPDAINTFRKLTRELDVLRRLGDLDILLIDILHFAQDLGLVVIIVIV